MPAPRHATIATQESLAEHKVDTANTTPWMSTGPQVKTTGIALISVWIACGLLIALTFSGVGFLLVKFDVTFIGSWGQLPESIIAHALALSLIGLSHVLVCGGAVWVGYLVSCGIIHFAGFFAPHKRSADY